jgi:hypothetical protein
VEDWLVEASLAALDDAELALLCEAELVPPA